MLFPPLLERELHLGSAPFLCTLPLFFAESEPLRASCEVYVHVCVVESSTGAGIFLDRPAYPVCCVQVVGTDWSVQCIPCVVCNACISTPWRVHLAQVGGVSLKIFPTRLLSSQRFREMQRAVRLVANCLINCSCCKFHAYLCAFYSCTLLVIMHSVVYSLLVIVGSVCILHCN